MMVFVPICLQTSLCWQQKVSIYQMNNRNEVVRLLRNNLMDQMSCFCFQGSLRFGFQFRAQEQAPTIVIMFKFRCDFGLLHGRLPLADYMCTKHTQVFSKGSAVKYPPLSLLLMPFRRYTSVMHDRDPKCNLRRKQDSKQSIIFQIPQHYKFKLHEGDASLIESTGAQQVEKSRLLGTPFLLCFNLFMICALETQERHKRSDKKMKNTHKSMESYLKFHQS